MPEQFPKRGAVPAARSQLAAATPYPAPVAAPPNFIVIPKQLSFWGNYSNGDCVSAEEAFAKACNNPELFLAESVVVSWATAHGVLNGAGLTQVIGYMQNGGFPDGYYTDDDGPYYSVDWTNAATLQSAIAQGPVKLGVAGDQLDTTWWAGGGSEAGGKSGWIATGYTADANEDHCVSLCGYGTITWLAQQLGVEVPSGINGASPAYALFTWDSIGIIDVPSMLAITHEAWLRQPTTIRRGGFAHWATEAGAKVVTGNFSGSGRTDIALVGGPGWDTVPVAFANGDGSWTVTNDVAPNFGGWAAETGVKVVTGNFSGSGFTDIALVGGPGWDTVPVAFANGSGGWTVTNSGVGAFGTWAAEAGVKVVTGNFSGSGFTDIALVGGPGWSTVPVAFANGSGGWTVTNSGVGAFGSWATAAGAKVVTGDFGGSNGLTDIALVGGTGWSTVPVAFSDGSGNWAVTNDAAPGFAGWATAAGVKVVTGNFGGSALTDIALVGGPGWNTVPLAIANGNGSWTITNMGA
jgi:hypothetical protein